jgi:hypothetical protein
MLDITRNRYPSRRRSAYFTSALTTRSLRRKRPNGEAQVPEWRTKRWTQRVEAEARSRLTRHVRGVGARR